MAEPAEVSKRAPKVLVVEDEIIIALGIQQSLQDLGYDAPEIAIREEEIEEKVHRLKPDLVLMDINLNGRRDGIDVARSLAQTSDVPVVFLTAYVDRETIDRAQRAGCYGYLVKPYEECELHSTLQMALGRSRVVRELQRSSDWFVTCLNAISDGVILSDHDGRVRFLNRAASELAQSDLAMAWGAKVADILHFSELEAGHGPGVLLQRCLDLGIEESWPEPVRVERAGRRSARWLQVSVSPVHDGASRVTGAVMLLRDVTGMKARDEERSKLRNLEALGRLAGGIAHDFNNLLTVIVANTSMLRYQAVDYPHMLPQLDRIQQSTTRAVAIANQFLTFARGGAPVVREIPTETLIRDVLSEIKADPSIVWEVNFEPDLHPILADEQQIAQALRAVIRNSVEAIRGPGCITISAFNVADGDSGVANPGGFRVCIQVKDTGEGISEENLPRIFDPYFTTRRDHSGLGLSSVHSIVSRHGGSIDVKSTPGAGTEVSMVLPASGQVLLQVDTQPDESGSRSQRVLVMDDEEMVVMSVRRMLESMDFEVSIATDGEEAIRLVREAMDSGRAFDAILLDLIVPKGMGGEEAIRQILKIDPSARAIVASGYSSHPVMSQFRSFGFKAVLPKPFGLAELKSALTSVGVLKLTRPPF
jgi:PAS domain S-box-containing protein